MTTVGRALRFLSLLSLASPFFGCSATGPGSPDDGRTGTTQSAEETGQNPEQNPLYTITIEDGHTIGFYELPAGVALVTETGQIGQAPILAKAKASGAQSLTEKYRFFRPADEVPAVIVAADERIAAFMPPLPVVGAPPPALAPAPALAPGRVGRGPKFYQAQKTWFKNTFCVNSSTLTLINTGGCQSGCSGPPVTPGCLQENTIDSTGWVNEGEFYTTALNDSESGIDATYSFSYWTGGAVGSGVFENWHNSALAPGYYQSAWGSHIGYPYYIWVAYIEGEYVDLAALGCGEQYQPSCVPNCGVHGCDQDEEETCGTLGPNECCNSTCIF
jgi:hypothetical protein